MPRNHFVRTLTRSRQDLNREVLQSNFMELHLFERFVGIDGMKLFHMDDGFMSKA